MKRIYLTLICVLVAVLAMPQEQTVTKHLTFMDVPICGKPNQFVKQMLDKGFRFTEFANEKTISMKGGYGGYDDCDLYIYVGDGNTVNSVAVSLPYRTRWSDLSDDYFAIKKLLVSKYGIPDWFSETFENPDIQDDWKMMYVETDRCEYKSAFRRDNGVIAVSITHNSIKYRDYSNVRVFYIDSPGADDVKSEVSLTE